ncbi:hypothetical protein [Dyadobacter frigoris]|uniref:AraC family transcriptional regulator n=1 Tax=Dyadobacter frigoris TaxID=2576211 RepID=A0A4U6DAH5_9BACT|nr:hypothetical protein [Dyadobacter frigoris]TKT93401.1 hypothetical protein FDK13_06000 [Dyadobacter frigoris]GLU54714.1 hypothetical protein Dfri01_41750 [Dyadobacter frigoris]
MEHFKQFSMKEIGYLEFRGELPEKVGRRNLSDFIKIVFLKSGTAVIDFKTYEIKQDTLFFINPDQYFHFDENCSGSAIYYNRDFYCVEIHDAEVACDGILFHNVYRIPVVGLAKEDSIESIRPINTIFERIWILGNLVS